MGDLSTAPAFRTGTRTAPGSSAAHATRRPQGVDSDD
jgi:hypothetical protein